MRLKSGTEIIAEERQRQVSEEHWSAAHDDTHTMGELRIAARCYLLGCVQCGSPVPFEWPWDAEWWKPSEDPIRNLARAGALIAAEIDRLQRRKNHVG